jgi:hypothetical protein
VKPGITVSRVRLGQRRPARAASRQQRGQGVDLAAQPQPHVGGHLVVAAAAGVQPLAGVAHQRGQARLDVEVHVFQLELPLEGPASISAVICAMPRWMSARSCADDALAASMRGMGQAAGDVGLPQSRSNDAGGVALHQLAHRLGEQRRPGL